MVSYLAVALILIGIILLAIGIALVVINRSNGKQHWWMWALIAGGGVMIFLGLALLIFWRDDPTSQLQAPLMPRPVNTH